MKSRLDLNSWSAIIALLIVIPLMGQVVFKDGFEAIEVFKWQQLGADIDGEANVDLSGSSVSLSADGSWVAIGAPGNDENGDSAGHVRVYQWTDLVWQQVGTDIDGEAIHGGLGRRVSFSADGSRVASGAAGYALIYQWTGSIWQQVGANIDGFGGGISLSADGSRVVIGDEGHDGNGYDAGLVRVYQWTGSVWQQMGADINGEAGGDNSGSSVSLSDDGSWVAIGARFNDGNGDSAGHVRIYQWTGSDWQQLGDDIDGEAGGDYLGSSVSLSADGSIVAIGTTYRERARIYQWTGLDWQQLGDDINGEAGGDFRPWIVSLSADGSRVAIGSGSSNFVRVFQWTGSVWQQEGAKIYGEDGDNLFGWSVSLSADGKRVAIGAPTWGFDNSPAGYVRVFTSAD